MKKIMYILGFLAFSLPTIQLNSCIEDTVIIRQATERPTSTKIVYTLMEKDDGSTLGSASVIHDHITNKLKLFRLEINKDYQNEGLGGHLFGQTMINLKNEFPNIAEVFWAIDPLGKHKTTKERQYAKTRLIKFYLGKKSRITFHKNSDLVTGTLYLNEVQNNQN